MTALSPTVALDIEAINLTTPPKYDTPSAWRPFAVSVAYQPRSDAHTAADVILRENRSARGARKLIAAVVNWLRGVLPDGVFDTDAPESATLVTFKGTSYDLPILDHAAKDAMRPRSFEKTLAAHQSATFAALEHCDLFVALVAAQRRGEKYPSLEESCNDRGIQMDTPRCEGRTISGSDMPELGRALLDGSITDAERDALIKYSRQDARVLVDLADALDREAHTAAEADAVADGGSR